MKTVGCVAAFLLLLLGSSPAMAEDRDVDQEVTTIPDAVRVTLERRGGHERVTSVVHGGDDAAGGCSWSLVFAPELDDYPYGTDPGPMPDPDAQFALLLCDGRLYDHIWVAPDDVIDLDAIARSEAQRYVEDVLVPAMSIGANPPVQGLVGLRSWFWIEGFDGQVEADPPIQKFGMTIGVQMRSTEVMWDFGDGTVESGDLGRAYPQESSVQHTHQRDGSFTVTATVTLAPTYTVNGGEPLSLPPLTAVATTTHQVEEREAVITDT